MKQKLQSLLTDIGDFSEGEIAYFLSKGVVKTAEPKTLLFEADRPFLKLWFLEKGIIRSYRLIEGKDISFFFFTQGEFAVDFESYLEENSSPLFFETESTCQYIEFHKSDIREIYHKYPVFEKLGRLMAEQAYLSATNRLKQFQADSLKERYIKLVSKNPDLFQLVPQYHLASYLGCSPQSLSRIKAQLQGKDY